MTHTGVHPFRITYHSEPLDVDVRTVVGYEGVCEGCWTGPARKTYAHARDDLQRHRREQHHDVSATRGTEAS